MLTYSSPESSSLDLAHYRRIVQRRLPVVVLLALLPLVAGVLYLQFAPRDATATTVLNINLISGDPFNAPRSASELIDADTELQTALSSKVLQTAAAALGDGSTLSGMLSRTTARVIPNTTVMRVSYEGEDRASAEAGADSVADAYLTFRSTQAESRIANIVDQLEERREALRLELIRVNTVLGQTRPNSSSAVQAQSERDAINIELDELASQINSFLGLDTTGGEVLTAAAENPVVVSPSRSLVLASSAGLGLLLGLLGAFALHAVDRRVTDADDVRRAGAGPVLATLPASSAKSPPSEDVAGVLRLLREMLIASSRDASCRVALIDLTDSGRLDVAVNLAHVASEVAPTRLLVVGMPLDTSRRQQLETVPAHAPRVQAHAMSSGEWSAPQLHGHDLHEGAVVVALRGSDVASALVAARSGHQLVLLLADRGQTDRRDVEHLSGELAVAGATVAGSVLVRRSKA